MQDLSLQTSLRDLISILFKRKWSLLTVFLAANFCATFYVFFIRDDMYQVSARVLVRLGPENEPPATIIGDRPMAVVGQRIQDVNSEADILTSVDLIRKLVDELDLDVDRGPGPRPPELFRRIKYDVKQVVNRVKKVKDHVLVSLGFRLPLKPEEEAIAMIQKGLLVQPQKESNIVVVNLFLPSRQFASAILNKHLELYKEFRRKLYFDSSAVQFFEGEVEKAARELASAEEDLKNFETQHGIRSLEEQESVLLRQISEAEARYEKVDAEQKIAAAKVARLEGLEQSDEPNFAALGTFERDSFPGSIMLQLAELEREAERLRMTPASSAALLENNRKQARRLATMLAENLRSSLDEKNRELEVARTTLAATRQRLDDLHARRIEWEAKRRNIRVLEGTHLFYRNKLEQASAAKAMEEQRLDNVRVIEEAIDPLAPTGIRKLTLLGMSLALALLAALAYVAVLEFFDHRIYTSKALETRTSAPVLAVVPARGRGGRTLREKDGLVLAPRG